MQPIIPPQPDARSPGTVSTCFDRRQRGQWFRHEPLASGSTSSPQCAHTNRSFRTRRNRLRPLDTANLLECGLRPHQGIGFGLLFPSARLRPTGDGLCSDRAEFTAVPLGSAITSGSGFTTACFIRRSELGPRLHAFVPAIVRQPPFAQQATSHRYGCSPHHRRCVHPNLSAVAGSRYMVKHDPSPVQALPETRFGNIVPGDRQHARNGSGPRTEPGGRSPLSRAFKYGSSTPS